MYDNGEIDADTLCAIIAQRPDYKKGIPIRLISCYTGSKDDGVASYVARKLKVEVKAPTKYAWINKALSGRVYVDVYGGKVDDQGRIKKDINDPGEWIVYNSDGGIKEVISGA